MTTPSYQDEEASASCKLQDIKPGCCRNKTMNTAPKAFPGGQFCYYTLSILIDTAVNKVTKCIKMKLWAGRTRYWWPLNVTKRSSAGSLPHGYLRQPVPVTWANLQSVPSAVTARRRDLVTTHRGRDFFFFFFVPCERLR